MLRTIILIILSQFFFLPMKAQHEYFETQWKRVDSLFSKEGRTETALKITNDLYARASKENNEVQKIKALQYRIYLEQGKYEDALPRAIRQLEKETLNSIGVSRAILQSLTAEAYWRLLQQVRFELNGRTNTQNRDNNFENWSEEQFHQHISKLYRQSLSARALLQKTSIQRYSPLLSKGNTPLLRPTVYDLLAHRALDYSISSDGSPIAPATAFEINAQKAFSNSEDFVTWKIEHNDSSDNKFMSLLIFQELLRFHSKDKEPSARIDADIQRIQYMYENAVVNNKNELYLAALKNISESYPKHPAAAQAWYLQAQHFFNLGSSYDASFETIVNQDSMRFALVRAIELCNEAVSINATSEGKSNCTELIRRIRETAVTIGLEEVNLPGKPFRMLVSFKNAATLNFRIIQHETNYWRNTRQHWENEYWSQLISMKPMRSFSLNLPDTKDYQLHRLESIVDALPNGHYTIVASSDPNFALKNNKHLGAVEFQVSNIGYFNKENDHFVVDRVEGKTMPGVVVNQHYMKYDEKARKNFYELANTFTSDHQGKFITKVDVKRGYNRGVFELKYNNDRLVVNEPHIYRHYVESQTEVRQDQFEKQNRRTFFYTDRAIYRPGQIVEFKGIVATRDYLTKNPRSEKDFPTLVVLEDANGIQVDSMKVLTNNFGSYHGKFTLPSDRLNGVFTIRDTSTQSITSFSVEEYKRPKFNVDLRRPTQTFLVNDTISIKGMATAFAGNSISNANVRYRVTRKVYFPIWSRGFGRIWPPFEDEVMEITSGITKTDAAGNFEISFVAIPDKKQAREFAPVFHFEVNADVTDMNGETHSSQLTVNAGYTALMVNIEAQTKYNTDSIPRATITVKNLNDIPLNSGLNIRVSKLKEPGRVLRPRLWEQPDQFLIDSVSYVQQFPFDIYKNENEIANWPVEVRISQRNDSANKELKIAEQPLKEGYYLLEVYTMGHADTGVAKHIFRVIGAKPVSGEAYVEIASNKESLQPGNELKYRVHTNLDKANIVLQEMTNDSANAYLVTNAGREFNVKKIAEQDRGHIRIIVASVRNNSFYSDEKIISVPYDNKKLKMTVETFRDRTLPAANEEWKLKIQSHDNKTIPAELVSVLYDASLDVLRKHEWLLPAIWSKAIPQGRFDGSTNFKRADQFSKYFNNYNGAGFDKQYTTLGYEPFAGRSRRVFSRPTAVANAEAKMEESATVRMRGKASGLVVNQLAADSTASAGAAPQEKQQAPIQMRRDFRETAFFFPDVKADENGSISLRFTMPDALTQWRWLNIAHSENLELGSLERTMITQKPLMVQPNIPRFLREGDHLELMAKVVNMTSEEMTGQVELQLIDPETMQPVDGWFRNFFPNQYFTAAAGESVVANFSIEVPFLYQKPVIYRFFVRSQNHTDGEENVIPILSNRKLVTETQIISMQSDTSRNVRFDALLNSEGSETISHHKLSVEYTTNPSWMVVQSLPYLITVRDGSSDQIFHRMYANAIAANILRSSPIIGEVMKQWHAKDTGYLSKLEQNQELKNILLKQTPWIFEAKSQSQQFKDLYQLFDSIQNAKAIDDALKQLKNLQQDNGAFSWMQGGPSDRFITQEILIGIGRLIRLNAVNNEQKSFLLSIAKPALAYAHERIIEDHRNALKAKSPGISTIQVHYLYMLSFYQEFGVTGKAFDAFNFYRKLSQTQWIKLNRYGQATTLLSLLRTGDRHNANRIFVSLKENAIHHQELGMYWKDVTGGYYWYQSAIEAQAALIEAFAEMKASPEQINSLKTWLIRHKQTNHWGNVAATADAAYALLITGGNWLNETPSVRFTLGENKILSKDQQEAGTGYMKSVIEGRDVRASYGNIKIDINKSGNTKPGWGAVYWQYFEDLDKIKNSATALSIQKQLFVEKMSDKGPVLTPIQDGAMIRIGDKLVVRLKLTTDRTLEYVHLQDMRAASLEPVDVLSGYTWNGGLGYYQVTGDASTDFYFDRLPKGSYQFEYRMTVQIAGTFFNGIALAQCMYAPEFISNAQGMKLMVEKE